jgi:hypothetical protein
MDTSLSQIKELAAQIAWLAAQAGAPSGEPFPLSIVYAKSLHLAHTDEGLRDLLAVKADGPDTIRGYVALWGDPERVDVDHEFFTAKTDFWDGRLPMPRPLTWDHAQDAGMKADPVVGEITELGDDDTGRWYAATLKRNHQYRRAIDKLIEARGVGTSSDSAPQYVARERAKSGATWLKRWPLFAAALTPSPAEPRMLDTVYWKSISLELPTVAPDGVTLPDGNALDSATAAALIRWYETLNILR